MGSMPTSDAAPLPRLGEVFFDVRSASRSLRISWYADTGVAVLSIWQGGTCTGSFRLPMADLPRMIETLQRGPDGWAASGAGGLPPADEPARTGAVGQDRHPAGSGSLHYLTGSPPGEYPDPLGQAPQADQPTAARYQATPGPARYPDPLGPAPQADQPAAAHYPDTPGPASYPDQPTEAHYPERLAAAHYPEQPAQARYQDLPDSGRYPSQPGAAQYPDQATERYPDRPGTAPYPDQATTQHYPDSRGTVRYPDQAAGYPAGLSRPDSAAGLPRGRYPNDSGPGSYSPGIASGANRPAPSVPPYDQEQPGWPAAQPETGGDTGHASPAGPGLEPLPESFPYSQLRPDHELR